MNEKFNLHNLSRCVEPRVVENLTIFDIFDC